MTVCSGLNGTGYVSATVVDIGVIFLSYDNVVHTVYLTVRVNPEAIIDLLLGRATLSQYNFNKLTPRALGFSLLSDQPPLRANVFIHSYFIFIFHSLQILKGEKVV